MSEINLLFVRHGQASASWENHLDPGLSKIGKDQAKNLTSNKKLPNLSNYDFLSSPKLRAIETSKPLAEKYKKEVSIDESFIEIPSSSDLTFSSDKFTLEGWIKIENCLLYTSDAADE